MAARMGLIVVLLGLAWAAIGSTANAQDLRAIFVPPAPQVDPYAAHFGLHAGSCGPHKTECMVPGWGYPAWDRFDKYHPCVGYCSPCGACCDVGYNPCDPCPLCTSLSNLIFGSCGKKTCGPCDAGCDTCKPGCDGY